LIVVDTSALVRIFLREPGYQKYQSALFSVSVAHVPVSCVVEFAALRRLGETRLRWLDALLERESVVVASVDALHRQAAVQAVLTYGKGSGHPAQLNFGDCLSYAVAKSRDLPLLYVGEDFRHTDIPAAMDPK
jgi:ribonuclease VapC